MNLVRCKDCGKILIEEESENHWMDCPKAPKLTEKQMEWVLKHYSGLEEYRPDGSYHREDSDEELPEPR
jgi:hypothetical protein